jgi:hypothetical protein
MAFRVIWPGKFGEQGSELVDSFEAARLLADALASYEPIVYVIDAETSKRAYSRRHKPEATLHSAGHKFWIRGSFLQKLIHRARSV